METMLDSVIDWCTDWSIVICGVLMVFGLVISFFFRSRPEFQRPGGHGPDKKEL